MTNKQTWFTLLGVILFFVGWWFLGEWDAIEYMSTKGQLWISGVFLALLLVISYFLLRGGINK